MDATVEERNEMGYIWYIKMMGFFFAVYSPHFSCSPVLIWILDFHAKGDGFGLLAR